MTGRDLATQTEEHAKFAASRLPWHPAIEERFGSLGVDKASWKALTEAVFPSAKSSDSVVMALSYCAARKLDPFKRPVHIVPMWDARSSSYVETVWPGISEIRTTAFRTSQYAGCDEVEFGPMIARKFSGEVGPRNNKQFVEIEVSFPEWGRMRVYRILGGQRCAFMSPKVYWLESYGRRGASDVPNEMWAKRPSGQLEKCVEAAALRKAFPEEVGNDYSAEEMAGQVLAIDTPPAARSIAPPPPADVLEETEGKGGAPSPPRPPSGKVEEAEVVEKNVGEQGGSRAVHHQPQQEVQEHRESAGGSPKVQDSRAAVAADTPEKDDSFDLEEFLEEVRDLFASCGTEQAIEEAHDMFADRVEEHLSRPQRDQYDEIHAQALKRFEVKASHGTSTENFTLPDESDPPAPSPADKYRERVRAYMFADGATPQLILDTWKSETEERAKLMSEAERKEFSGEVQARINELLKPVPEPEPAKLDQTVTEPEKAAEPASDTEAQKFTDEYREGLANCQTTTEANDYIASTLPRRNKLSENDDTLKQLWRTMGIQRRNVLNGIA